MMRRRSIATKMRWRNSVAVKYNGISMIGIGTDARVEDLRHHKT